MPNLPFKAFYFILILTGSNLYASDSRFILKEHIVVDLERQIEWLRCSVGQRWDGVKCAGEIINLSLDVVPKALDIAGEQLGGKWRLPSKAELQSIVCKACSSPKIDNNSLLKTKIPTMTAALTKKLSFVEKRMSFL